jgi:hypothetical protein
LSIDHVSKVLNLGPEVAGTDRLVLLVLAEAANAGTDECWPSVGTVAKRAGLRQAKYVQKALGSLQEKGLIEVDPNGCPDHRIRSDRRPNLYRMVGEMAVLDGGARRAGSSERGGASRSNGGARRADTGGRVAPPKPEGEPEGVTTSPPAVAGAVKTKASDVTQRDHPSYGFDRFWDAYPARNGKKVGKAKTLQKWRAFPYETKAQVFIATRHYAAACSDGLTIAKDPERFLTTRFWEDWLDGPGSADGAKAKATPQDAAAQAEALRRSREERRRSGQACPTCEDRGVVEDDEGLARDCPACRSVA